TLTADSSTSSASTPLWQAPIPEILADARGTLASRNPTLHLAPRIEPPDSCNPVIDSLLQHGTYCPGTSWLVRSHPLIPEPLVDIGLIADQIVSRVIAQQLAPLVLGDTAGIPREQQLAALLAGLKSTAGSGAPAPFLAVA